MISEKFILDLEVVLPSGINKRYSVIFDSDNDHYLDACRDIVLNKAEEDRFIIGKAKIFKEESKDKLFDSFTINLGK